MNKQGYIQEEKKEGKGTLARFSEFCRQTLGHS